MSGYIKNRVKQTFIDSIYFKQKIIANESYRALIDSGDIISSSISNGGKFKFCGNGGSAADAQHFTAEFSIRLTSEVNRESTQAPSLVQDTSILTACINDYASNDVFKRVFSALAKQGDIFLAFTPSSNSKNIVETLKLTLKDDIYFIGFLGNNGEKTLGYCDSAFVVPGKVTAKVQESCVTAGKALLQYLEDLLLNSCWLTKD